LEVNRLGGLHFKAILGKKFPRHSGMYLSSLLCREAQIGGQWCKSPRQKVRPYLKIDSVAMAGRVAQVTKCLPSKCKALYSNPSTTKTTLKNKKIFIAKKRVGVLNV
jgi:hypothetical protein